MLVESNMSLLYSDTLLPDVFITEYMPSMDGDYIKVYIQCLFLAKRNKQASAEDLSKALQIDAGKVKDALTYFENMGLVARRDSGIVLVDLKDREIKKIYRMKTTSSPEDALLSTERNKRRNSIITAINNMFFQGVMSPAWYTDIDAWFDRYKFEEDVMLALFRHCYDHKGLSKNYIAKVAENWYSKNIRNSFDLDKYFIEYQKLKDIRMKIVKKLKRQGMLTEYEEDYIEKWVMDYKYDFEIIELALKKTTAISNPNFEYINKILTDWYENGLRTKEDIIQYERNKKAANAAKKQPKEAAAANQMANFKQRKYDKDFLKKFYENV